MSTTAAPVRRSLRNWLIAAIAVAAVAGLIVGLGGFEPRRVFTATAAPGDEIDAVNLVFRLDSATVQYLTKASSQPWKVVVSGAVRNPHDETLTPLTGAYGNLIGIQDGAEPAATGDYAVRLGPANPDVSYNPRQQVPPDNRWMTLTATYRFDGLTVDDSFDVRVVPMEFTANAVLGISTEPTWNVDYYALPTAVMLPLTRLPDGDY
ncbi:MAG: hypothetical protein KIT69_13325 [Propionibacteriaceae bacterium]|nr:hypothetical protein [Propionibacteriaceae bacterium]